MAAETASTLDLHPVRCGLLPEHFGLKLQRMLSVLHDLPTDLVVALLAQLELKPGPIQLIHYGLPCNYVVGRLFIQRNKAKFAVWD